MQHVGKALVFRDLTMFIWLLPVCQIRMSKFQSQLDRTPFWGNKTTPELKYLQQIFNKKVAQVNLERPLYRELLKCELFNQLFWLSILWNQIPVPWVWGPRSIRVTVIKGQGRLSVEVIKGQGRLFKMKVSSVKIIYMKSIAFNFSSAALVITTHVICSFVQRSERKPETE